MCGHCADFDFTNAKLIIPCTEYKPRKQKGQKAPTPAEINETMTDAFGPDWESMVPNILVRQLVEAEIATRVY